MIGIYKITSPNGKIYVGKSICVEERIKAYRYEGRRQNQHKLNNTIKKYGLENLYGYLVYLEMRRRNAAPKQIEEILDDLGTLTEYESKDWVMVYKKRRHEWSPETFAELVPLTPNEYRERTEGELNEMRVAAGIATKDVYRRDANMRAIQAAAGIL